MGATIQDYSKNEDIKFALNKMEADLANMNKNRESGHWLSPQLDRMDREIQLMKWAIKKIKNEWNIS